jgi:hypothetical protein
MKPLPLAIIILFTLTAIDAAACGGGDFSNAPRGSKAKIAALVADTQQRNEQIFAQYDSRLSRMIAATKAVEWSGGVAAKLGGFGLAHTAVTQAVHYTTNSPGAATIEGAKEAFGAFGPVQSIGVTIFDGWNISKEVHEAFSK